jgi:hypothetical protein
MLDLQVDLALVEGHELGKQLCTKEEYQQLSVPMPSGAGVGANTSTAT